MGIWLMVGAVALQTALPVQATPSAHLVEANLAQYIEALPGALKEWRDGDQTAASVIQMASDLYAVSPRMLLALLETTHELLSSSHPPDGVWQQPISDAAQAPLGFAEQIEWAAALLRAGLGPYDEPPVVEFVDGTTATINLAQAPEGIAVQRILAQGRTASEWHVLVGRFVTIFDTYFEGEIVVPVVVVPERPQHQGFLQRPWPAGVRVRHLAYFDHAYPTVDTGRPDNGSVVTYLGPQVVQYDGHDGHDYAFPDQLVGTPILAAAPGMAYASTRRGYGVYILHADGYTTVYWHLDKFSRRFKGLLNSGTGVPVVAGDFLGTSGSTGFVVGTPHLHFEVRRYGKQVDPYGWYGVGEDPCITYPQCAESVWLWDDDLQGEFDFTPPDVAAFTARTASYSMQVAPLPAYRFVATFDEGFAPELTSAPVRYTAPVYRAVTRGVLFSDGAALQIPQSDPLGLAGGWSAWVNVDALEPGRSYVFAQSAHPDEAAAYAGTLALRVVEQDASRWWELWSVSDDAAFVDRLQAPLVGSGWQHVTATWHVPTGGKRLIIDGQVVAQRSGVTLPTTGGDELWVGRFPFGRMQPVMLDDVIVWDQQPTVHQVNQYALAPAGTRLHAEVRPGQRVVVRFVPQQFGSDPVVSMRLAVDGDFQDPEPFAMNATVFVPADVGDGERMTVTVGAELYTRAGAVQYVAQTLVLSGVATGDVEQ
jgi:murein DD-endopeptidase MepM/ murein hydrolase activator NlpD